MITLNGFISTYVNELGLADFNFPYWYRKLIENRHSQWKTACVPNDASNNFITTKVRASVAISERLTL